MKQVSVIVPTYNERGAIVPLLAALRRALCGYFYEIIAVDDLSPDGTAQAVRDVGDPQVRLIGEDLHGRFAAGSKLRTEK